jgi:transcriptional regulator with XRE-family HTH domain
MELLRIYVILCMSLRKIVGSNIRNNRKEKGWSQEKLAGKAKLTSDYVGSLERGQVNVSLDALERICKCLEITITELFIK